MQVKCASSSEAGDRLPPSLKVITRSVLRRLSSFPLAIGELGAIAGLSALGTLIEQNKPVEFYVEQYPEGPDAMFGFLSWKWIGLLQLDHIYTANYFLALMGLLAASLAACTSTRQLPLVKVARRWKFAGRPATVLRQGNAEALPRAETAALGTVLDGKGYQVFLQEGKLYAFKGLAGKLAPIGVHASMLAIMAGVTWSGLAGLHGSVQIPEGADFSIAEALRPKTYVGAKLFGTHGGVDGVVHVDDFSIDYRSDGTVRQFVSDLSVLNPLGRRVASQEVNVNTPLHYKEVTMYQTDWAMAAIVLKVQGSSLLPSEEQFALPMAPLAKMEGKVWGTFVPIEGPDGEGAAPRGISLLARDLQSVVVYDSKGKFAGVRRPGSGNTLEVEGLTLQVDRIVCSTGLELKVDPGVPFVYAGFAGLMLTTIVSYLSHSEVWALQEGDTLFVSGKSNRASVAFANELSAMLDSVPVADKLAQSVR